MGDPPVLSNCLLTLDGPDKVVPQVEELQIFRDEPILQDGSKTAADEIGLLELKTSVPLLLL